ncbi:hypothetical protein CDCA_CDCA03G0956 [Cyanidium caldarium]|uniref:Origin recognition complex subunit 5 n=1 Tax=Cyanidium caldarium TaxID=2771 RepID=A0AAV9IS64_CYACA|nr:hypothetical protein CDCA_CDCA03G0956 [Cyanidium caldarium]
MTYNSSACQPCLYREREWMALYALLAGSAHSTNTSQEHLGAVRGATVYVYGAPSTGKTTVTQSVLETVCAEGDAVSGDAARRRHRWVRVDCQACLDERLLYQSLLRAVASVLPSHNALTLSPYPTSFEAFFRRLFTALSTCAAQLDVLTLHLVHAHKLRSYLPRTVLTSLLQLTDAWRHTAVTAAATSALPVALQVVFEAVVPPEHLVDPHEWPCEPELVLHFSAYSPEALQTLLMERLSADLRDAPPAAESTLRAAFVQVLLDVLGSVTQDLRELAYWSDTLFPHYLAPCRQGRVTAAQTGRMYAACLPHLKRAVHCVYAANTTDSGGEGDALSSPQSAVWSSDGRRGAEADSATTPGLSQNASVLLLASFLAARISPRDDYRVFGPGERRRGKASRTHRVHDGNGRRYAFPLERLLSIARILHRRLTADGGMDMQQGSGGAAVPWLSEVAALARGAFLSAPSTADALTEVRLTSQVTDTQAQCLATALRVDLNEYLLK